jgi:hypothetical protein
VELGAAAKGLQIIASGVAVGDRIVVDGTQKVTEGAVVDPRPVPDAQAAGASSTVAGAAASAPSAGAH